MNFARRCWISSAVSAFSRAATVSLKFITLLLPAKLPKELVKCRQRYPCCKRSCLLYFFKCTIWQTNIYSPKVGCVKLQRPSPKEKIREGRLKHNLPKSRSKLHPKTWNTAFLPLRRMFAIPNTEISKFRGKRKRLFFPIFCHEPVLPRMISKQPSFARKNLHC